MITLPGSMFEVDGVSTTSLDDVEGGAVYRSFLLRVWHPPGRQVRASVEDVDTGEVDTFDGIGELCAWIEHCVDDDPQDADRGP